MRAIRILVPLVARVFVFTSLGGATAFAHGGGVNNTRAAELGLHRIERIVSLRRADPVFLAGLTQLKLTRLVRTKETDPLFRVIGQVAAPVSGPAAEVEILLDGEGKTLQSFVTEGGFTPPANPLPGTDPVTLTEAALHYVLDKAETREELEPFEAGLSQLMISSSPQGVEVVVSTPVGTKVLKIRVNLAGAVESAEVIDLAPPAPPQEPAVPVEPAAPTVPSAPSSGQ